MYKKDDIVVCLLEFDNTDTSPTKGGSGYEKGRLCKIYRTSSYQDSTILWPDHGGGIHVQAVRLATENEIKAYTEGIRNLKDVPVSESIINNYSIF